jgi:Asp-tRNA(Asn)/Glu-tRNA(Gln) amidotransferase A subunit family amidase
MGRRFEMMFAGVDDGKYRQYPRWVYQDGEPPLLVHNEADEAAARAKGYDSITAAALSNRYLVNWFWDLEDFSPKQLRVFCKEEYGVDLPADADQETLFKAAIDLTRAAPQNRNRMVLMAHSMKMNYDETLSEIKRMQQPGCRGVEADTVEVEFWA